MNEQLIHIDSDGDKFYYKDKTLNTQHRVDGPAVEYISGNKFWYVDGKLHRVDGPAVERATGIKSWYIDDVKFSEAEFNATVNPSKSSCEGKTVVVDGVTYKLKKV